MPENFVPTTEQADIINFEPSGHLLVRGEAGSGKTTVLAERAGRLQNGDLLGSGKLLFLTYNVALAKYVESLLEKFDCEENVTVSSVKQWVSDFYYDNTDRGLNLAIGDERKRMILVAKAKQCEQSRWRSNHLADEIDEFWHKEIEWIVGQGLSRLDQYKQMKRIGRGTVVQVRNDDREFVWEVFTTYKNELKDKGLFDGDDLFGIVKSVLPAVDGKPRFSQDQRYDHICIDEVQDFYLSWLMIMVPFASRSLTLAGDLGQRIYHRGFSWKNAKVELDSNRSRSLKGSHRTTKQIMEVATLIIKNDDVESEDEDNDYVAPSDDQKREGPKVRRLKRPYFEDANNDAAKEAARLWEKCKDSDERIVIAAQGSKVREKMAACLSAKGVPAKVCKQEELLSPGEAIPITTLHQLKGLEFEYVIIADLGDNSMPKYLASKSPLEKPEEAEHYLRRLVYVAMTRARKEVVLAGGEPFCRFFNDVPEELFEDI